MTWSWESLSASLATKPAQLLATINERMKSLEQMLANLDDAPVHAKAYTTNATTTTLATEAAPASKTLTMVGLVTGRHTGGSGGTAEDAAGYHVLVTAKNDAGTAAVVGSVVTVVGESQAGWNCAVDANGGNIRVRVTGAANNNVTWVWSRLSKQIVTDAT